jgi:hypothetical protein
MNDDDMISLFKAGAWADAKGALHKIAEVAGQARHGSRHAGSWEKIEAKIEVFIEEFEGEGLHE